MFLEITRERNPELIDYAFRMHDEGTLSPDTYVIDRDAVDANAATLACAAKDHGIELWFVVKQIGRNPLLIQTIARHLPYAAAIDIREAELLISAGAKLGNVGHLVQIPRRNLPRILALDPKAVTVYDEENLRAVDAAAASIGRIQDILLKVEGAEGAIYPGQEGGIPLVDIEALVHVSKLLGSIRLVGVTAFPCVLYSQEKKRPVATSTLSIVQKAANILRLHGIVDPVIDLPSHSSVSTLSLLAKAGATHAEPGHALTGTTPQHAGDPHMAERPAIAYLSEIAHHHNGSPSVFGGGFYPRGRAEHALVRTAAGDLLAEIEDAPAQNIDYYRTLRTSQGDRMHVGDPVVMAFRTQIFVTRSRVAIVSGLSSGKPRIDGVFGALGEQIHGADPGEGA